MAITNHHWYNKNDQRSYPVHDAATLIDDDGVRLPHNIISDLMVRYPDSHGDQPFLSSVTVSPHLVTITIQSAGTGVFTPVASVAVPRPVEIGRHYPLEGAVDGAGGWAVFGTGSDEALDLSLRFSTVAQARLAPRSARAYRALPVTSLGKRFLADGLSGVVTLTGGNDIKVYKDTATIEGVLRDVIKIGLADKTESTTSQNTLAKYIGSCDQRAESLNCAGGTPIEYINNVPPDCCGNVVIELRGCGDLKVIQNDNSGVALDCNFGMDDACISGDKLPDADGTLPNEYADLCSSISYSDLPEVPDESEDSLSYSSLSPDSVSPDVAACLPYLEHFESSSDSVDFSPAPGTSWDYVYVDDGSNWALTNDPQRGGLNVWDQSCSSYVDWETLYMKCSVDFQVVSGGPGTTHRAGIAFQHTNVDGLREFYTIELDADSAYFPTQGKTMSIVHYADGVTPTALSPAVSIPNLSHDHRYMMTVIIGEYVAGSTLAIVGLLTSIDVTPGEPDYVDAQIGPYQLALPGVTWPPAGDFGVYVSKNSLARFEDFNVDVWDGVSFTH